MRIENIVDKKIIKIYEGLRAQIREDNNISVDDINQKLDIIMDALGLTTDDNKEEQVVEKEEETTTEEEETTEEKPDFDAIFGKKDEEKEEEVTESLDYKQAKYEIHRMNGNNDFQVYDADKHLVFGEGTNSVLFDSFDNLIEYLKGKISYSDMETLTEKNDQLDHGLLLLGYNYEITKNK